MYFPLILVSLVNPHSHKIKPDYSSVLFITIDLILEDTSSLSWMPGAIVK
jgi:hypothetical protein